MIGDNGHCLVSPYIIQGPAKLCSQKRRTFQNLLVRYSAPATVPSKVPGSWATHSDISRDTQRCTAQSATWVTPAKQSIAVPRQRWCNSLCLYELDITDTQVRSSKTLSPTTSTPRRQLPFPKKHQDPIKATYWNQVPRIPTEDKTTLVTPVNISDIPIVIPSKQKIHILVIPIVSSFQVKTL